MSTKRTRRLFSLLAATAVVLTSCGGGDSDSSSSGNRQRNAALTQQVRQMRTKVRYFDRNSGANLALSNEDELIVWGNQMLSGSLLNPPVSRARVAALGNTQAVAIDPNNQFHAWGSNPGVINEPPADLDLSTVVSLSLDDGVVMAIDEDGKLWAWGSVWTFNKGIIPEEVRSAKIVNAVSGNAQVNAALDDNGTVHVWGSWAKVPEMQTAMAGIKAKNITLRDFTLSVVTTDGKIVETGSNPKGSGMYPDVEVDQFAIDWWGGALAVDSGGRLHFTKGMIDVPTLSGQIDEYNLDVGKGSPRAVAIAATNARFTVLFENGDFQTFANFTEDGMYDPDYFYSSRMVSPIAAGNYTSFAVRDDYTITNFHTLREGEASPPAEADYLAVASGWSHVLGLRKNGTVVSWGDGPDGNAIPEGLAPVRQIGAGHGFSAVRDIFGQISSWGSFQSTDEPKEKPDGDFVYRRMSTGFHNIIATGYDRGNGSDVVHVWGDNYYGQADVPDDLDASNVRDVSVGYDCAAAVMYDGSVRIWGKCETNQKAIPAGELFDSVEMSMGLIAGVTFDGDVLAWGNSSADLGTKPTNMKNVAEIAVGSQHIIALDYNGEVSVWGPNVWGESNVPDDLKSLPVDDVYDENYDDNLSDEAENVASQMESAKNPIPTPTIIDDTPVFVVKNGEVVSVPPTAPSVPDVTPILEKEPISMTVLPATLNPVTKTGKVVTVADAVKMLRLKKITKAVFVVPSKVTSANAKVCSITKTAVTITGTGVCDVKLSYVDSKKKKQTKALPLIGTP